MRSEASGCSLGTFDVGDQSLWWCRLFGCGGFTITLHHIQSSHHQITSKNLPNTNFLPIQSFPPVLSVRLAVRYSSFLVKRLRCCRTADFFLFLIASLFSASISSFANTFSSVRPFTVLHRLLFITLGSFFQVMTSRWLSFCFAAVALLILYLCPMDTDISINTLEPCQWGYICVDSKEWPELCRQTAELNEMLYLMVALEGKTQDHQS